MFDPIAYEKTGSVLAMIEAYVGPEAFRRGVSSYLKRFSYANASGEDFWAEMARVTGKPVDQILSSFVDQPGIPLLSVESAARTAERHRGQADAAAVLADAASRRAGAADVDAAGLHQAGLRTSRAARC